MSTLAKGHGHNPLVLEWLSKTAKDDNPTSPTSDPTSRIFETRPEWLSGSTAAVPDASAAILSTSNRQQRNRSVDSSSIISTNDLAADRDPFQKQSRRKTRPDKYNTKKQARAQGTDQAERRQVNPDRSGTSHSEDVNPGKKRRKNAAGAARVADMPHSTLMSQGRISVSAAAKAGKGAVC